MISIELIKAIDTCESDMKNKLEINQKYHMQNSKNFFLEKNCIVNGLSAERFLSITALNLTGFE